MVNIATLVSNNAALLFPCTYYGRDSGVSLSLEPGYPSELLKTCMVSHP